MKQKTTKKFIHIFGYLTIIGISIFVLLFVISCSWIGHEVKAQCETAKNKYQGDCVEVLIQTMNDDTNTFRARNDAIWSLGQLGDGRALPALEKLYTGDIPHREPLNGTISQYELRKAIKLTSGGLNITAFFWRDDFLKK